MDRHQETRVETTGTVLTFPPPDADDESTAAGARVAGARAMARRRQRAVEWLEGSWMLLAALIAAERVRFAIARREVFGAEAAIAFVLVISTPLVQMRRIVAVARWAASAMRRAISRVRGAAPQGQDASPPRVRRHRPRKGRGTKR